MPLFRRRPAPEIDYDVLAEKVASKALSPAIAMAATRGQGSVSGATYDMTAAQTGGGQQTLAPLPRPGGAFNSGFGPGYPLFPDPLDPAGTNGRTPPRRSEYLVAWNLQLVDRQVPWTMLRWLAEDCDIVNRCIQLTQDEQCGLNWGWTYSPQILQQIMTDTGETNSAKATAIAREKYGAELSRVQQFFDSPDSDMNQTFSDWLQALLWDHLCYDGVAVYPRYNLDGSLRNLELVDASTIKLYRDNAGRIPQPPAPAYGQILYGFPRGEFQHTPGDADDEWKLDQLSYFIRRPRNTSVYGYPQVEEVMALATTYLARQQWMRAEYTTGVTPRMMVEVAETNWTPEQMSFYESTFNDRLSGQIDRRQMAFFLPPGVKTQFAPQIEEHYKSDYDNWLISQVASRFGRPATMLGVQAKAGLSGGKQMEGEMDQSDIYSGKALSRWLVGVLNSLAQRYLGAGPEITATCVSGQTKDMLQQAQADASDVAAGIRPRNEVRAERGYPIVDEPEADQLAITTAAGVTFMSGLLKQQTAAQEAAAATPAPAPTLPGQPAAATAQTPPPSGEPAEGAPPSAAPAGPPSDTAKELSAFSRFADNRIAKGAWRDFRFTAVDAKTAETANQLGSLAASGQADATRVRAYVLMKLRAEVSKAEPDPKAGAAKRRAGLRQKVIDEYRPKFVAAYKNLYPGAVDAAKTASDHHNARTEKADSGDAAAIAAAVSVFHRNLTAVDLVALIALLKAMHTDAWSAGVTAASAASDRIAAAAGPVTVTDGDLPEGLQTILDGDDDTASRLADGMLGRLTNAVTANLGGDAPAAVDAAVNNVSMPGLAVTTETATVAEAGAQAAYQAAGIDQWNWEPDAGACDLCASKADDNPHDAGDPQPPAHPGCGCGSSPIEE